MFGRENHRLELTKINSTSFQRGTNSVEENRNDNGPFTSTVFVGRRQQQSTSHSAQRHARVHQTVLPRVQAQVFGQEEVGTRNQALVQAREETTHTGKRDEQPRKVSRVTELDVEHACLETSSGLELGVHLVNKDIDVMDVWGDGRKVHMSLDPCLLVVTVVRHIERGTPFRCGIKCKREKKKEKKSDEASFSRRAEGGETRRRRRCKTCRPQREYRSASLMIPSHDVIAIYTNYTRMLVCFSYTPLSLSLSPHLAAIHRKPDPSPYSPPHAYAEAIRP